MDNKIYQTYEVIESFERADTMMTQYTEFGNYVLKYGKDGISCVDSENQLVWSQTYSMQSPIVQVCKNAAALAEENGTTAMIFDESGLQGTVQTRLPIRQISVSSQGVLAVLLEDGDIMRLNLYNKKGEELVTSKFELQDTDGETIVNGKWDSVFKAAEGVALAASARRKSSWQWNNNNSKTEIVWKSKQ